MNIRKLFPFVAVALLISGVASADIPGPGPRRPPGPPRPTPRPIQPVPTQVDGNRDPVALARRDPAVARVLGEMRGEVKSDIDETAVQITVGEQCGFAGCGTTTLVAFSFKTRGANPRTQTALALVSCGPVGGCKVALAEARAVQDPQPPTQTPPTQAPKKSQAQ